MKTLVKILCLCLFWVSCGEKHNGKILGKWVICGSDVEVIFNDDYTGITIVEGHWINNKNKFNWNITDENYLEMSFDKENFYDSMKIEFKDNDILIIHFIKEEMIYTFSRDCH